MRRKFYQVEDSRDRRRLDQGIKEFLAELAGA